MRQEDIFHYVFHYVYAVLHNPAYRKKYELNLKREFACIAFYDGFWKWATWGKRLMELPLSYETATPYQLNRIDVPHPASSKGKGESEPKRVKPKLKANKEAGVIEIDEETTLNAVPKKTCEYRPSKYRPINLSALELILDQCKESTPKDKTIAERFNAYRFADYKERVIDLFMRVCTVSVEIVNTMMEGEGM